MKPHTGVLLVNLGTPDAPTRGAVRRYLYEFLTDGRVIDYPWIFRQILVGGIIAPIRSGKVSKLYQELWTEDGSPLKVYGERLAEGVQERLGAGYQVELAMRYQNPSIPSALDKLVAAEVKEYIVVPLFPQYASATTGSVHQAVMDYFRKKLTIPNIRFINSYADFEPMIDVIVDHAQQFDLDSYDHIFFSYHGLPARQLREADNTGSHCQKVENCCEKRGAHNQFCYGAQCHATTAAIAEKLNLSQDQYTTTFQSRFGPEAWVQPYTSDVLKEQAEKGSKRLLAFSPAFVADCLETIIEISEEYQEEFEEMGGEHIDLVPSLNDDPKWMDAVAELVQAEVAKQSVL